MNFSQILILFLFLACFLDSLDGAVPPRSRTKRRKKKTDYKKKFHCLVCLADYSTKRINFRDTCINPAVNVTEAESRYLTVCPSDTNLCAFELVTINDVFTAIERRCATTCTPSCFQAGYGTEKTICTYCCNKSIKPDDFNEDTVYEYTCAGLSGSISLVKEIPVYKVISSVIVPMLINLFTRTHQGDC